MSSSSDHAPRLWRMRRRRDHIDATLSGGGSAWTLTYWRNDRAVLSWEYESPGDARAEAERRRLELARAGWTSHW